MPTLRRPIWLSAALIGLALTAAPAIAEAAPTCRGHDLSNLPGLAEARAKRADDLVNAGGLFWRIDKFPLPPSWLFGTIHSTDEDALALARRAAQEIPGAKVAATELGGPMDAMEKAGIGADILARALDRDRDTFARPLAGDTARTVSPNSGRHQAAEICDAVLPSETVWPCGRVCVACRCHLRGRASVEGLCRRWPCPRKSTMSGEQEACWGQGDG